MRDKNVIGYEDDRVVKVHLEQELYANDLLYVSKASELGIGPKLLDYDDSERSITTKRHLAALTWFGADPSQKTVHEVGKCLLDKIEALHGNGICHRDIHIRNLIMTKEDEPLIIDWEFAIPVDPTSKCYDIVGPASGHPKPMPHRIRSSTETGVWWNTPMKSVNPIAQYFGELDGYISS